MPFAEDFVALALTQTGDRYVWGGEADPATEDPDALDCSELVQWAANRLGVDPAVPDGSWIQARHCSQHGTLVDIGTAVATRGALLFRFSRNPFSGGRPSFSHVAISLGDGSTIEARGASWGIGSWSTAGRGWTHAALVPGLDYGQATPAPAPPPVETTTPSIAVGRLVWPELSRRTRSAHPVHTRIVQQVTGAVVDGDFYNRTALAVEGFQTTWRLAVDGAVGPETGTAIVQNVLRDHGYDPGTIDGDYGPATTAAVARFQAAMGIGVDGVFGDQSTGKLHELMGPG